MIKNKIILTDSLLVSVIIPCYNAEKFLEKAVNSILNQTYRNLEIWIIDDGSQDNTRNKIIQIIDERVRLVLYDHNTRKIGAVNEVLQQVQGDLICFQDADDWSDTDRIKQQVNFFQQNPSTAICFTGYTHTAFSNKGLGHIATTNEELRREFLGFGKELRLTAPTICATMMITREALISTGGYHPFFAGRVGEDIYWVYSILKNFKGKSIPNKLYHVNVVTDSLTYKQYTGDNIKASYSWELLEKIIAKEQQEGIDMLMDGNKHLLKAIELEACEEKLKNSIQEMILLRKNYEESTSYKVGKILIAPLVFLKRKLNNL